MCLREKCNHFSPVPFPPLFERREKLGWICGKLALHIHFEHPTHHPPQQDPVSTNRNGNGPIWVVKRKCCDFDCSFRLLLLLPLPRAVDESGDDVETAINRVEFYYRNQSHSAGFFAKLNFDGSFQTSNSNESQFPRMHFPTPLER